MGHWIKRLLLRKFASLTPAISSQPSKVSEERINQWMREAYACHQSGKITLAKQLYKKILSEKPDDYDALYLLGTIYRVEEKYQQAAASIEKAIQSKPDIAIFHYELGSIHQEQKAWNSAEFSLRAAIRLGPEYAEAYNDLGTVLLVLGNRAEEALECLQQALKINANLPQAHYNLGRELIKRGEFSEAKSHLIQAHSVSPDHLDTLLHLAGTCQKLKQAAEAETFFSKAVSLDPRDIEARMELAGFLFAEERFLDAAAVYRDVIRDNPTLAQAQYSLGCCYEQMKRPADAKRHYFESIRLDSALPEACVNLGNILFSEEKYSESLQQLSKAIELKPSLANAYLNLGRVLSAQNNFQEAIQVQLKGLEFDANNAVAHSNLAYHYFNVGNLESALQSAREAIELNPDYDEAYINLGAIHGGLAKPREALAAYNTAIAINPNSADAHFGKALILLLTGDFENGWQEYEWRWKLKNFAKKNGHAFDKPLWDGASRPDKTLLIHAEQGMGDTIHFSRYIQLAARHFKHVALLCPKPLKNLFTNDPNIETVVANGEPLPLFDFHAPMLSLPLFLETRLSSIPATVPYMIPDERKVEQWRETINARIPDADLKVGIVWAGGATYKGDKQRSCTFEQFVSLGKIPGTSFVSLQKGLPAKQAEAPPEWMKFIDMGPQLNDFSDTAALIDKLDLVISVDTAVAHLAGAMNKPVWTLIPFSPDFRWLMDRDDSPWYPSMRLFRQRDSAGWAEVFERIEQELSDLRPQ